MFPHEIREKYALRKPAVIGVLQFLSDSHLHPELKRIVTPIRDLAFSLVSNTADGPELTIALRHLIDAKDSFVRHHLAINNFQLGADRDAACIHCLSKTCNGECLESERAPQDSGEQQV